MSSEIQSDPQPQNVELILSQLDSLPPLAPVATRILSLTEDSEAHARQIVELIESDPVLTARVLSALGRAEHGVRREAVTVKNAVLMLGFGMIRQLTLAIKVMEVFGTAGPSSDTEEFDRLEFWKHCLGVACAARRLAMIVPAAVDPEEAFVLGLLHDIGKDALHAVVPKSFARVLRKAREARAEIIDVERAILGLDHTVVGHRLAERWALPQRLVECIWLHHHGPEALPTSVAAGKHVQIVALADMLVREYRIGFSGNHRVYGSSRESASDLGVPETDWLAVVEALPEEIESRSAWIGDEEITSREVYFRALMRSTDELASANTTLVQQNQRLERTAEYFAALRSLNQSISPRAPVREICAAAAEALRKALSVSAVVVFAVTDDGRWLEAGSSDGTQNSEILQRPEGMADEADDVTAAVQSAMAGTWIAPPGRSFDPIIDRYRRVLRSDPGWLLPLVREQRWVAGALLGADAGGVARLRGEAAEIEALSSAAGLAIAQAQAQASAIALNDELAAVTRRLSSMQAELLQTKTLQSIVAMAAGAGHELNNPLAVISARAQMLRGRVTDDDTRIMLAQIAEQALACSAIVTELMEFAQPRPPVPEKIRLREFIDGQVAELVSAGLLDVSALSIDTASDTPPVRFDREQLSAIFGELVRNAVEATDPATRRLTVKVTADLTEESVVMTVADNGRGMTSEVLSGALDPFFSNRPAGRGRGLGLARVHRWMQENGGTIRLESEPGEGTQIRLRLPATGESAA